MSIYFHKEDRDIPNFENAKIEEAVKLVCKREGKIAGDINFIYCSDEYLLGMNEKYLEHDYYTDIITFNYNEGNNVSGDIFMSRDRIEDNAMKLDENLNREFIRVCGHGILHLLGQEDGSDKQKEEMRQKEEEFIEMAQ